MTIYLRKKKSYNTLCPANSYNAHLGRTRLKIKTKAIYDVKVKISPPWKTLATYFSSCRAWDHVNETSPRCSIDCSQSSIFPEDGPDRGLCVMGCILHECQNYLGGYNPRGPLPPYIWKSRWPPLTVRRAISRRSHEKIGDCEQSSVSICFSILLH